MITLTEVATLAPTRKTLPLNRDFKPMLAAHGALELKFNVGWLLIKYFKTYSSEFAFIRLNIPRHCCSNSAYHWVEGADFCKTCGENIEWGVHLGLIECSAEEDRWIAGEDFLDAVAPFMGEGEVLENILLADELFSFFKQAFAPAEVTL